MEYVIFDYDGTLGKGYISMEFLDYLCEQKIFPEKEYQIQMEIQDHYKKKLITYDYWVEAWGASWARAFNGIEETTITNAAKKFYESSSDHLYQEAKDIVKFFKDKNCFVYLISAGAYEVVKLAAEELEVDDCIATKSEIKLGVYTGKLISSVHTEKGKGEALGSIIRERGSRPAFVFGDSTGDISMLKYAKNPIALNPNQKLTEYAKEQEWITLKIENALSFLKNFK